MRKSRLSKDKQERLMEHFVSGSTARCAANLVGVNKTTAAYYFHRLREIIDLATENEAPFHGEINKFLLFACSKTRETQLQTIIFGFGRANGIY